MIPAYTWSGCTRPAVGLSWHHYPTSLSLERASAWTRFAISQGPCEGELGTRKVTEHISNRLLRSCAETGTPLALHVPFTPLCLLAAAAWEHCRGRGEHDWLAPGALAHASKERHLLQVLHVLHRHSFCHP